MRRDAFYASDLVNSVPEVDPKTSGLFGCVIDALKLYNFQGDLTDAAIGATNEDRVIGTTTYSTNGNGYVFGAHQTNPLSENPLRLDLVAGDYEAGQEVGDLGLAAGQMLPGELGHPYLTLYVSAHRRDYKLAGGGVIANVGAADAYRIQGNTFKQVPILAGDASLGLNRSFTPVPHPVSGIIEPDQSFGSVIRVIDVDGDTFLDLVIGAPGKGRVYIFWGDSSIPDGVHPALSKVTILDAPDMSHNGFGGGFGNDIAVGFVDSDTKGDLLIGQPKWGNSPSLDFQGRAYLILGSSIAKPTGTTMVLVQSSFDRLFEPPPQPHPALCPNRQPNFGWYLWMADIDGDQKLDLLIHAETECWPGTANGGVAVGTSPSAQPVDRVGALFIWRQSSCSSSLFCSVSDVQLFGPVPTYRWRFSKNLVFTKWWNAATQSEQPAVVISEPETERPMPFPTRPVIDAGTISLYFLSEILYWGNGGAPLSLKPSWQLFNDFMDYPLLPAGPSPEDLFGRWMAAGHFGGGASQARAQIVVTASGHQVPSRNAPAIPVVKAGCGAHLEQGDP